MSADTIPDIAPWIQTVKGNQFWPKQPDPELIRVDEIALVLSRTCRFAGHTREGSDVDVAWHSLCVHDIVKSPKLKLPALLHDAHEVYTGFGDVCASVKQFCPELKGIERGIDKAIATRFGFDVDLFYEDEIKHADLVMLSTEREFFMEKPPAPWIPLPPPLTSLPTRLIGREHSMAMFRFQLEYLFKEHVRCPDAAEA